MDRWATLRTWRPVVMGRRGAVASNHPLATEAGAAILRRGGSAADAYVVQSGARRTIIAGYPWFTDWGRDTFISMRGLLLARGRADVASMVLQDWSQHVSEGMLPNRFPDGTEEPQYNAVDASLWFVIAAHETMAITGHSPALAGAVDAILRGQQHRAELRDPLIVLLVEVDLVPVPAQQPLLGRDRFVLAATDQIAVVDDEDPHRAEVATALT